MHNYRTISIGVCSLGPLDISKHPRDYKHVICISNYDKYKHTSLLSCKTTSQNHDKVYPGEFFLPDLFGKGKTKVQPYNIHRVTQSQLNNHSLVGKLDSSHMPKFELGLKLAIKSGRFRPLEILDIADSWQPFFAV